MAQETMMFSVDDVRTLARREDLLAAAASPKEKTE